ncbi:MAG: hypothetical protein RL713_869 [Bacteroidota bacterium]|jgi:hypothetical protein
MNDHQHILSELSSISPLVADMPRNSPFEAPEGYFQQFSSTILQQIQTQEIENEELSPFLQSLKKENPYSVPPDYMQQFKVEIKPPQGKVVRLFNLKAVLKYEAAAAVIGIIATFATLFFSSERQGTIAKSTDEVAISADGYALFLNETASIEEDHSEESIDDTQSLLVQMDANTVTEILSEIPENEISTYIDLIKNEDLNMMN